MGNPIMLPRDLGQALARPLQLGREKINARARDWYRIENKDDDEATVYIYDEIGYWGVTAADFVRELQDIKAGKINLHLNTPGGDVFDGIAIHNALKEHRATVRVQVDSLAASIGSVIAMAGDTVIMAKHSTMMIHDPFGLAYGNAADMRKLAEVLDQLGDTIAGVYAEHAGGSVREWRDRMLEETWYNDRAAVDAGLADEVAGEEAEAENSFDLSMFKNTPAELLAGPFEESRPLPRNGREQPTKRTIERALRDAGLTRQQAKAFVAAAFHETERDEEARDVSELIALRDALKVLI